MPAKPEKPEQPKPPEETERERAHRLFGERLADMDHTEAHDAEGHLMWEGMNGLIVYADDAINLREYGKTRAQIIAENDGIDGASAPD